MNTNRIQALITMMEVIAGELPERKLVGAFALGYSLGSNRVTLPVFYANAQKVWDHVPQNLKLVLEALLAEANERGE